MKVVCHRNELLPAFQQATVAAASRDAKPVLRNIKATVAADRCTLQATDLELGLRLEIQGDVDEPGEVLLPAARLFSNLTQVLRLCLDGPLIAAKAADGLKALLVRAGEAPDFARLEADLAVRQAAVARLFNEIVA